MIAIPPAKSIPPLESIAAPFRTADFTKVPELKYFTARDNSKLAYREYIVKNEKKTVVLIHGSSGSSLSMHPLAEYLYEHGITVYSPDVRGHGGSGRKGDIDYIGQLENDLEDFVDQKLNDKKAILAGFSAGGSFVLRFAASDRQTLFGRYIVLSPVILSSPAVKPNSGGWADVSYPRIIGITLLQSFGEKVFGHLPIITYAVSPDAAKYQTAHYSFRLNKNFLLQYNYKPFLASIKQPLTVLVGDKDELHNADAFEPIFAELKPGTKVIIVPNVGHITLTTSITGISAVAKEIFAE